MSFDAQYETNLARVVAESGGRTQLAPDGSLAAIITAHGQGMAWLSPGLPSDRETGLAAKLAMIAVKAAGDIRTIRADSTRSPTWIEEHVAATTAAAHATFAAARQEADKLVADFATADVREAQPAALAPTDAVGAIMDAAIQSRVLQMTPAEHVALAKRFSDGEHPRVLDALLRDPFGLPKGVLADSVPGAWLNAKAAADPQGARLRRQAAARIESLSTMTAQAEAALPPLTPAQRQAADIASAMAGRTA
jgi:hypothetical protein